MKIKGSPTFHVVMSLLLVPVMSKVLGAAARTAGQKTQEVMLLHFGSGLPQKVLAFSDLDSGPQNLGKFRSFQGPEFLRAREQGSCCTGARTNKTETKDDAQHGEKDMGAVGRAKKSDTEPREKSAAMI